MGITDGGDGGFRLSETSDRWFFNSDGVLLRNSSGVVDNMISNGTTC